MIIAGLTGGIGHGKTTFSSLLAEQARNSVHFESWELVAEVANALRNESLVHPSSDNMEAINEWLNPLPDIISWTLHIDCNYNDIRLRAIDVADHPEYYAKLFEYLILMSEQPELLTVEITTESKEIFRPLLQWLGGYMFTKLGGVWYGEIARRIGHLRSNGLDVVTVGGVRFPDDAERLRNAGGVILDIQRPTLPELDSLEITERDRTMIEPDVVIRNDGSLEQLSSCAEKVYEDLCMRTLQPQYTSVKV